MAHEVVKENNAWLASRMNFDTAVSLMQTGVYSVLFLAMLKFCGLTKRSQYAMTGAYGA